MKRLYQGIDIVGIQKFRDVITRNEAFISDIFTEGERAYCLSRRDPHVHLAGRFAVKEASLKALGLGISASGIDRAFREIETTAGPCGRTELSFSGWIEKISKRKKIAQMNVTVSHTADLAVAGVILVGGDDV